MSITFKRHEKITGLAGIGYPYQSVDIKLDKKIIGVIHAPKKWIFVYFSSNSYQ